MTEDERLELIRLCNVENDKFMTRFNGVATKYLDYYVNYFQSMKSKIDGNVFVFFVKKYKELLHYKFVCKVYFYHKDSHLQ